MQVDSHHILFERPEWCATPESRMLRSTPSLTPLVDYQVHHEVLHPTIPAVPYLGRYALQHVINDFCPTTKTLSSIDKLLACIEAASKHPKSRPIEKRLAELVMEELLMQRDLLKGNMTRKYS